MIPIAVSMIGFGARTFRSIETMKPSISQLQYLDIVSFQEHITSDSVIVAPNGGGLSYWIGFIENTEVFGIPELSPEL